jgi:transcriptional regulator with XRE-family HTH domain
MSINAKIKNLRVSRGYTLERLAELTGFTKGYLSKIERSTKTPPFATVQSISEALQADITELLDNETSAAGSKNLDIMPESALLHMEWEESSPVYSFKPLLNHYKNKYMSPFIFRVGKGYTEETTHDSEEFVYVLDGNVELRYEGKAYMLGCGSCFYLDARIRHHFVNTEDKPAILLAVHFNYRRF